MTRLARLSALLVALAVAISLAATQNSRSPLFAFLVTLAACALALGVAIWIDDALTRREDRAQVAQNFQSMRSAFDEVGKAAR